jgi:adenosine kinase
VSQTKTQVVVCGSIAIDRIMNFQGRYRDVVQPDKLHVLSVSVLLDKLEDSRGGIGANITSSLARLGEKPVLIGSVGQDAKDYVDELNKLGVDTTHLHFSNLPTASFNVITDKEDNQVGGFYQGAMSDSDSVSFKPWANQDALMVISAHNPAAMNRQIKECKDFNLRLAFDPGQQVSDDTVELAAGVAEAEIIFVNDYELGVLCQKINLRPDELKKQVPILVTTLGKDGSLIEGAKVPEPVKISRAEVEAVDPTGAGDGYRAGFLYGYLRQWDLKKCGQLGATVASFIVEKHGTQQAFTTEQVAERYRQAFNEEIEL